MLKIGYSLPEQTDGVILVWIYKGQLLVSLIDIHPGTHFDTIGLLCTLRRDRNSLEIVFGFLNILILWMKNYIVLPCY